MQRNVTVRLSEKTGYQNKTSFKLKIFFKKKNILTLQFFTVYK
jgi:hypothetical protein